MISEEQREKIQRIVELFDFAEEKVKEVERLDGKLSIPSINELRYVGYHLAKALCSEGSLADAQLEQAKNHCNRAIYDAYEVGIIYFLEYIKAFKKKYAEYLHLLPPDIMSTYVNDVKLANDARDSINQKNSHPNNDRDSYYQDVQPHYEKLKAITGRFDTAEPIINSAVKSEQEAYRRFLIGIIIGVISIIVGVIALFK